MPNETLPLGYLHIVLNAHTPFVKHPKNVPSSEEYWLFNNILECYLPLLDTLLRLKAENVPYRISISLSPTLITSLADRDLQERFILYLNRKIKLVESEIIRNKDNPRILQAVEMYRFNLSHYKKQYLDKYQRDLIKCFKSLQESGHVEILTTCATGAFLPILEPKESIYCQVKVGVDTYEEFFDKKLKGFWLPSLGYRPGIGLALKQCGAEYTIIDALAFSGSEPTPKYASFLPIKSHSNLTFFANDLESKLELGSSKIGYLYSPQYRDFYQDLSRVCPGLDLGEFQIERDKRPETGLKYYRITGPTDQKEVYLPKEANRTAWQQATSFLNNRLRQIEWLEKEINCPPIITVAFNAEMLGRRWLEGCLWLEYLIRQAAAVPGSVSLVTSAQLLNNARFPEFEKAEPNFSSWMESSFMVRWLNNTNDWVYKQMCLAGQRMAKMINVGHSGNPETKSLLNQAAKELILAQCGDWPLMLSTGQQSGFAARKLRNHLVAFHTLFDDFREGRYDRELIEKLEEREPIFKNLDYEKCFKNTEGTGMALTSSDKKQNKVNRTEVLAHIVNLQKVTAELSVMCEEALLKGSEDKSIEKLSAKAKESVAIVENLVTYVNDADYLKQYVEATENLESFITKIATASSYEELSPLKNNISTVVAQWGQVVETILKSVIAQAIM